MHDLLIHAVGIPACQPCLNSGSICDFTDPVTKVTHPREFISTLEDKLASLEDELQSLRTQAANSGDRLRDVERHSTPSGTTNSSEEAHPDLIQLEAGGDAHFLGVSSGMCVVNYTDIDAYFWK